MVKLSLALLLSYAVMICGCKQSTGPTSTSSTPIFPLTQGNTWSYQVSEFDSTNTLQITYPETVTVGSDQVIGTDTWHTVIRNFNHVTTDTSWYTIRTDGLWLRQMIPNSTPAAYTTSLQFKYPTSANDTFDLVTNSLPPQSPSRSFVLTFSTSESQAVSAGTFTCIHYQSHSQNLQQGTLKVLADTVTEQDYVTPGTGLIQSVKNFTKQSGAVPNARFRDETVLMSYSVH